MFRKKPTQEPTNQHPYGRSLSAEQQHGMRIRADWDADDARLQEQEKRGRPAPAYVRGVLAAVEDRAAQSNIDTQPILPITIEEARVSVSGLAAAAQPEHYTEPGNGPSAERVDFTQFR